MPSKSKAQQRLMAAAEHGADFPMARKLRQSMSHDQLHDFAVGSMSHKPEHVSHHSPPEASPTPLLKGSSYDVMGSNVSNLKSQGLSEHDATKRAIQTARGFANPKKPYKGQHKNLKGFLHPRKDGKPHGSDCM